MASRDAAVREKLAADGSLYEGYHPAMEAVHDRNASRLTEILDAHGWPGRSLVGEDGERAAWLILQHAIGHPALQRRGLELLAEAADHGEAPLYQVAMLEDRIRLFEGRPQRYGTHFDWDEAGEMSPLPIEDPEGVDERRRAMDLGPLDEDVRRRRAAIARDAHDRPPRDPVELRKKEAEWLGRVGWR